MFVRIMGFEYWAIWLATWALQKIWSIEIHWKWTASRHMGHSHFEKLVWVPDDRVVCVHSSAVSLVPTTFPNSYSVVWVCTSSRVRTYVYVIYIYIYMSIWKYSECRNPCKVNCITSSETRNLFQRLVQLLQVRAIASSVQIVQLFPSSYMYIHMYRERYR